MMINKSNTYTNFESISTILSPNEFEQIKNFVLEKGDRKTYRNFDNHNPHYKFEYFDIFLGSDLGQRNINNNHEISDFNLLTIHDKESNIPYYQIIIVRAGDLKDNKAWIIEGMKEGEVYLVDFYHKGLDVMKDNLPSYIEKIRRAINSH